mmetsp:Transcript_23761/g.11456  ORF Transcript_23761/g.11456 Transcript_23761/m.11456 type:complete len:85 (+) Transcript_23761:170-424(+)
MKTLKKSYYIDKKEIYFLKFLLEAYDGIAVMETIDSKQSIIILHVAPGCKDELNMLIKGLADDIKLTELKTSLNDELESSVLYF